VRWRKGTVRSCKKYRVEKEGGCWRLSEKGGRGRIHHNNKEKGGGFFLAGQEVRPPPSHSPLSREEQSRGRARRGNQRSQAEFIKTLQERRERTDRDYCEGRNYGSPQGIGWRPTIIKERGPLFLHISAKEKRRKNRGREERRASALIDESGPGRRRKRTSREGLKKRKEGETERRAPRSLSAGMPEKR